MLILSPGSDQGTVWEAVTRVVPARVHLPDLQCDRALGNTKISGSIPVMSKHVQLKYLKLDNTNISGTLHPSIVEWVNISSLWLNTNTISGEFAAF